MWAPDPYHSDDPHLLSGGRPWLVLSEGGYPTQGEDYLCCALTSRLQRKASRIPLREADWMEGQPPRPSQIDPTTVMTMKHDWVAGRVGSVAGRRVEQAARLLKSYF